MADVSSVDLSITNEKLMSHLSNASEFLGAPLATTAGEPRAEDAQPDLLKALWRKKWLVMSFVIVGGALGYWYHMRRIPMYVAHADILVTLDGQRLSSLTSVDTGRVQLVPAAVERVIISSTPVLSRAIENNQLEHVTAFRGVEKTRAIGIIRSRLSIEPLDDENRSSSQILRLSYVSGDPLECVAVPSVVINAHDSFLKESQSGAGERIVTRIREASDLLREELDPLEKEYREFRESSPLMWDSEGVATNPYRAMMTSVYQQRVEMTVERTKLIGEIHSLESVLKNKDVDPTTLFALIQMNQPTYASGRREVSPMLRSDGSAAGQTGERLRFEEGARRRLELERELQPLVTKHESLSDEFGSQHPSVRRLRTEVDAMRNLLERLIESEERLSAAANAANAADLAARGVDWDPRQRAEAYLVLLKERLRTSQQQETELATLYEENRIQASRLSQYETTDMEFRRRMRNTQTLYDNVASRLQEIKLFDDNSIRRVVNVLNQSENATMIIPGKGRDLGMGAVLGMIIGSVLALLVDLSNRTFYTPEEVTQTLRLPVLSHVPTISLNRREVKTAATGPCDSMLVAYYQPKSQLSEAFRGARTQLFHLFRGQKSGVIVQVTSPHSADGKSLLAANLAVSIAQAGRRTLLIDADMRRPTQQLLFRQDGADGFSKVLAGAADINEAIVPGVVPNLDLLPCGKRPANPAEVLCSGDFANMLEWLRERYDYILIDSAPVLAVTDPSNIAPLADGVVVTFRLSRDARPASLQAIKQLDRVGARVLGVVVNDVGDFYGANSNGYSYTEVYGYGYGDDARRREYFQHDQSEPRLPVGMKGAVNGKAATGSPVPPSSPSLPGSPSELG